MRAHIKSRRFLSVLVTLSLIAGMLTTLPMLISASGGDCPVHDRSGTADRLIWAPILTNTPDVPTFPTAASVSDLRNHGAPGLALNSGNDRMAVVGGSIHFSPWNTNGTTTAVNRTIRINGGGAVAGAGGGWNATNGLTLEGGKQYRIEFSASLIDTGTTLNAGGSGNSRIQVRPNNMTTSDRSVAVNLTTTPQSISHTWTQTTSEAVDAGRLSIDTDSADAWALIVISGIRIYEVGVAFADMEEGDVIRVWAPVLPDTPDGTNMGQGIRRNSTASPLSVVNRNLHFIPGVAARGDININVNEGGFLARAGGVYRIGFTATLLTEGALVNNRLTLTTNNSTETHFALAHPASTISVSHQWTQEDNIPASGNNAGGRLRISAQSVTAAQTIIISGLRVYEVLPDCECKPTGTCPIHDAVPVWVEVWALDFDRLHPNGTQTMRGLQPHATDEGVFVNEDSSTTNSVRALGRLAADGAAYAPGIRAQSSQSNALFFTGGDDFFTWRTITGRDLNIQSGTAVNGTANSGVTGADGFNQVVGAQYRMTFDVWGTGTLQVRNARGLSDGQTAVNSGAMPALRTNAHTVTHTWTAVRHDQIGSDAAPGDICFNASNGTFNIANLKIEQLMLPHEANPPASIEIYDLTKDDTLANVPDTHNLFRAPVVGTLVGDNTEKTVTLTGRSDNNDGIDIRGDGLVALLTAGKSYRFNVTGTVAGTGAGTVRMVRVGTTYTLATNSSTPADLAGSTVSFNTTSRVFEINFDITQEALATLAGAGNGFFRIGTNTGAINTSDLVLTGFTIFELPTPPACECPCDGCGEALPDCTCLPLPTPDEADLGFNFNTVRLTGLVPGARYTIDGGAPLLADPNGTVALADMLLGKEVSIIRLGVTASTNSLPLEDFAIPARLITPAPTVENTSQGRYNGKIIGVDTTMQYRAGTTTGEWIDITAPMLSSGELVNLQSGFYQVRRAATTGNFVSLVATVRIGMSFADCAFNWTIGDDFDTPPVAGRLEHMTDANVALVGTPGASTGFGHVLELTVDPDFIKDAGEAVLTFSRTIPSTRGASSRRLFVWTDLSAPEGTANIGDISFPTTTNTSDYLMSSVDAVDIVMRATIPESMLNDGTRTASKIYVLVTSNNAPTATGTTEANNRGGQAGGGNVPNAEHKWSDVASLSVNEACRKCGECSCEVCGSCDCPPTVHMFPLPLNKAPAQNHSDYRQGWEEGQIDSPTGGLSTRPERRDAELRYLVVEFETPPGDFGVVFQGNQVDGNAGRTEYHATAPGDIFSRTPLPGTTFAFSGWFGGYMTPSTITAGGVPAKITDTLYAFDFGNFQGTGHFPAKWSMRPEDGRFYWHPGFSRDGLYNQFQILFETSPNGDGPSFDAFIANVTNAYFSNLHPNDIPEVPEVELGQWANIPSPAVLTVDTTGSEGLKLYYDYTASGISAVRMQYSIDGGTTWNNIHRDFSIIDTAGVNATGSRVELLPVQTYDEADLRIRWIPHGVWGRGWDGGSFSISNVKLVSGLQHGEIARPVSPVREIGAIPGAISALPQRGEVTLSPPTVTMVSPSNTNTGVLWTSSNAGAATVAGGRIRALQPGETLIRAASVADPSVFAEFAFTVTPPSVPLNPRANFIVDSPYADVIWETWGQYKAAHHTHSWASDGNMSTAQHAARHYELGFNILAVTDHDRPSGLNPWDNTQLGGSPATRNNVPPTQTQVEAMAAGNAVIPSTDAGRTPADGGMPAVSARGAGEAGMIFIPNSNELSGLWFDEISQARRGHHLNVFWAPGITGFSTAERNATLPVPNNEVTNPTGRDQETIQSAIQRAAAAGGISRINHPGRYTLSLWPLQPFSEAAAIANNAANFIPYANLFIANPSTVGMEIINKFDTESQADRILWDNILSVTMAHPTAARAVWGFSDDDSHSNNAIGFSYNIMLMPELTAPNVRTSMENGTFLAFSRVDRQYNVYPRLRGTIDSQTPGDGISRWDWDGSRGVPEVLAMSYPEVNSIEVVGNRIVIDATFNGAVIDGTGVPVTTLNPGGSFIDWYADGVLIHRGNTLDLREKQLSIYSYVRATIITPQGVIYTQPFGIKADTPCSPTCVGECGDTDCVDCPPCEEPDCCLCNPCITCPCIICFDKATGYCGECCNITCNPCMICGCDVCFAPDGECEICPCVLCFPGDPDGFCGDDVNCPICQCPGHELDEPATCTEDGVCKHCPLVMEEKGCTWSGAEITPATCIAASTSIQTCTRGAECTAGAPATRTTPGYVPTLPNNNHDFDSASCGDECGRIGCTVKFECKLPSCCDCNDKCNDTGCEDCYPPHICECECSDRCLTKVKASDFAAQLTADLDDWAQSPSGNSWWMQAGDDIVLSNTFNDSLDYDFTGVPLRGPNGIMLQIVFDNDDDFDYKLGDRLEIKFTYNLNSGGNVQLTRTIAFLNCLDPVAERGWCASEGHFQCAGLAGIPGDEWTPIQVILGMSAVNTTVQVRIDSVELVDDCDCCECVLDEPCDCDIHGCEECGNACSAHGCTTGLCNRPCTAHNCTTAPCNRPCTEHTCTLCGRTCSLDPCIPCGREPVEPPPVTTTAPPATTTAPPVTTTAPPVTTTAPPVTTTAPPAITTTAPPATTTAPPETTTAPPVTTTPAPPPVVTTSPPPDIVPEERYAPEDFVDNDVVLEILQQERPVIDLSGAGANEDDTATATTGTVLSAESVQAIAESGKEVEVILPSGISVTIDPANIGENAGLLDLNIEVTVTSTATTVNGARTPANSIVISPPSDSEYEFEFTITLSAEQLEAAGLRGNNVKLFVVDENGAVTELDMIKRNDDGSITIPFGAVPLGIFNFADGGFNFILAEEAPISAPDINPTTAVTLSVTGILISGAITLVVKRRRK